MHHIHGETETRKFLAVRSPERGLALPTWMARDVLLAAGCFAIFLVLTGLVWSRTLVGLDYRLTEAKTPFVSAPMDAWATISAILASAELSTLLGTVGAVLLWRAGLGRWSLAPLGFLLPTLVELLLKSVLQQPPMPSQYHRPVYYPLITISLSGSFPSGHALRSAFLCCFSAVILWRRSKAAFRLISLGLIILALAVGLGRFYAGDHWLTDVIGGFTLGAGTALLLAPPVVARLSGTKRPR